MLKHIGLSVFFVAALSAGSSAFSGDQGSPSAIPEDQTGCSNELFATTGANFDPADAVIGGNLAMIGLTGSLYYADKNRTFDAAALKVFSGTAKDLVGGHFDNGRRIEIVVASNGAERGTADAALSKLEEREFQLKYPPIALMTAEPMGGDSLPLREILSQVYSDLQATPGSEINPVDAYKNLKRQEDTCLRTIQQQTVGSPSKQHYEEVLANIRGAKDILWRERPDAALALMLQDTGVSGFVNQRARLEASIVRAYRGLLIAQVTNRYAVEKDPGMIELRRKYLSEYKKAAEKLKQMQPEAIAEYEALPGTQFLLRLKDGPLFDFKAIQDYAQQAITAKEGAVAASPELLAQINELKEISGNALPYQRNVIENAARNGEGWVSGTRVLAEDSTSASLKLFKKASAVGCLMIAGSAAWKLIHNDRNKDNVAGDTAGIGAALGVQDRKPALAPAGTQIPPAPQP